MFIIKDREIKKIIEGKKVVILGSAPSVLKNDGEYINSFDLIVRINNYKMFGFEKYVGNRTDIFYSYFGRNIKKENSELLNDGVKLIMSKYPNNDFTGHTSGQVIQGISDTCKWVYDLRQDWWKFPVWIPKLRYFRENYNRIDRIPTTGMSAVLDILRFSPCLLYITGFDFMRSKIHNVDEAWNDGDGNHDHMAESKLMATLDNNPVISFDCRIAEIINSIG